MTEPKKRIQQPYKIIMWLRTSVMVGTDEECWPVIGAKAFVEKQNGYSVVSQHINGKQKNTGGHRIMWELFNGPIPKGMVIDHMCHNEAVKRGECLGNNVCQHRRCVNPSHLVLATQDENKSRGVAGPLENIGLCRNKLHEWIPENILVEKNRRRCKLCNRELYKKHGWKQNEKRKAQRAALREAGNN